MSKTLSVSLVLLKNLRFAKKIVIRLCRNKQYKAFRATPTNKEKIDDLPFLKSESGL